MTSLSRVRDPHGFRPSDIASRYRITTVAGKPETVPLQPPCEAHGPNHACDELTRGHALRLPDCRKKPRCVYQVAKVHRGGQSLVPGLTPAGSRCPEVV